MMGSVELSNLPEAAEATCVPAQRLHEWVVGVLMCAGLTHDDSVLMANSIVEAESRGIRSHGLILLPIYVGRLRSGGIKSEYALEIIKDTGPLVVLDGNGGPGQPLATRAMSIAIERTKSFGMSYVCMRNSNHIGILATYGLQAVRAGFIGLVMTNSSPAVSVARGRGRRLGSNAFCVAIPAQDNPMVIDMSTGTVASGKVRLAALHGEQVPAGWIQDRNGEPSQDPAEFDRGGSATPFGGYKGYALGVVIDVMTALLAGGPPSPQVTNQIHMSSQRTQASQSFAALDPDLFVGRENFMSAVKDYGELLRQTTPLDESLPVLAPGDPELECMRRTESEGIRITTSIRKLIDEVASSLGVEQLLPSA